MAGPDKIAALPQMRAGGTVGYVPEGSDLGVERVMDRCDAGTSRLIREAARMAPGRMIRRERALKSLRNEVISDVPSAYQIVVNENATSHASRLREALPLGA
ncbi:MAG: hypothetical protein M3198_18225 [Actinomycetota bacterium]|nr:hypothetical protein [Actinomycetota bacterium]